jgi:hypothetical protein
VCCVRIILEYFNVIEAGDRCIVHDLKYASDYHYAVTRVGYVSRFSGSVYDRLSKECCSCYGQGKHNLNIW